MMRMRRGVRRERSMMRARWDRPMGQRGRGTWPTSRNVLTVTLLRGSVPSKRKNDISDGLGDLSCRMGLRISRAGRRTDMSLDIGCRATNFLRSTAELITMRSPVGTVSDVLHDAPQRSSELRVVCESGAESAEECSDIAGKSRGRSSGRRIELCKRGVWGIVGGGGGGRWNFLDIDGSIRGERDTVTRDLVYVNRGFLWGVVGENRIGGRGRVGLASFSLVPWGRCRAPGMCGGSVPGRAGAETGVTTHPRKLDLVPRSGTNLATVEGIEPRNSLPIILDGVLMERNGSKRVAGRCLAEPVGGRRSVWEGFIFESPDDAEVYDSEASKQGVGIGSVVIFEFSLGAESDLISIDVGIRHSDMFDGNAVQRLELGRYFEPRRELGESDATGYTVFAELELGGGGHGCG